MRAGEATRLLRVVREVSLAVLIGVVTNDLHRVLVGTHGTVRAQAIELSLEQAVATHRNLFDLRQRGKGNIVDDTHGEVVLRHGEFQVVEHRDDLGRSGIGRTETITATNDKRLARIIVEGALHVEIQRLTLRSGLLGAVEHSNALCRCGDSLADSLDRERTIEMDSHHTDLLTLLGKVVDSLAGRLCGRTHQNDDVLSIRSTIVVEEVILTTCNLGNLSQVLLNYLGYCVVVLVASLAMSEEGLRVLGSTTCVRTLRAHGTVAETLDPLFLHERTDVLHIHLLNLVVLVRSTEAIEEVDERHRALQGREIWHSRQIHHLLH